MERRKVIIYGIFMVTSAYGIYFHFLSDDSKKEVRPEVNPPGQVKAAFLYPAVNDSLAQHNVQSIDVRPERKKGLPRNPFLKENKGGVHAVSAGRAVHYARPSVSAVSPGGPDTFVIANGKILKIGESTGVWTLLKAEDGRALFSGPGGAVWVKIGG